MYRYTIHVRVCIYICIHMVCTIYKKEIRNELMKPQINEQSTRTKYMYDFIQ